MVVLSDTKMFVEDTQVTHCLWRGRDVNKNGTISILEDASVNYCDRTILGNVSHSTIREQYSLFRFCCLTALINLINQHFATFHFTHQMKTAICNKQLKTPRLETTKLSEKYAYHLLCTALTLSESEPTWRHS